MRIFGEHDINTLAQFRDVASRAEKAALMADGHFGYVMPIGGVAGYRDRVSVVGVGFDIACGNAAVLTNLTRDDLTARVEDLADEIFNTLSFGVGRNNDAADAPTEHPLFEDDAWLGVPAQHRDTLRDKARDQLGTIGGGNHYVDVFFDGSNRIWVGAHFGSRGLGHAIASNFLALSQGNTWGGKGEERETLLDLTTPLGHDYWHLMQLAGRYAYAGREWVVRKVVSILGGEEVDLIHNHHNFAWKEQHGGEDLVVVRKGATPAWPGQRGFVGGSMGDEAVILEGVQLQPGTTEAQEQAEGLFSTVHGAGRVMSRTEARGRWRGRGKNRRQVTPGKISREAMVKWLDSKGVVLRGGDIDEAPQAYRRLPAVLAAQGKTVRVLHQLKPMVVCMAPGALGDPYKD